MKEKTISTHGNNLHFDIEELKKLNNPKVYLYELLNEYGFTEWDDVADLLNAQSGKQVYSTTHRLLKDRDFLILSETEKSEKTLRFEIQENISRISIPIHLKLKKVEIPFDTKNHQNKVYDELFHHKNNTISIDYNKIQFPLTIRKWQKGDFFFPIGLNGKKKVSKFFKDEKLSLIEKEKTWLLCSKNEIVWIIGRRLDDRFKVSKTTSTILKIKS
ncbi:MAG: tRNA lysidine(34) synthetase TilS [Bacteroidetes bacterium]|nr:tRNA lysidine(34) synthetase TilS [Bacteroidota bacterium]